VQSVPKWTFGAGLLVWWRELCIHCLGARHRSDWSCDAVRPSCSAVMGLAVPARASCRVYRSECGEPARDLACGAAQYGRYAAATYGGRDDANGSRLTAGQRVRERAHRPANAALDRRWPSGRRRPWSVPLAYPAMLACELN
jgi:hypothetical protein